jgi:TPR repeat protein
MRFVFVLVFICCTSSAIAVERSALCEDSPLDIFPDEFYTCEALQSFKKGFDKHALALFKRASRWGSKQSQYKVGLMYVGGFGTQRNPVEGAAWLLLANERNNHQGTEQLKLALADLDEQERAQANLRAVALREEYGDLEALERRAQWVRRMKRRTTGSHLGRPTATLAIVGTQGITGGQALSRLDHYEATLRNVLTTVEYRDFKVLDPEEEAEQVP